MRVRELIELLSKEDQNADVEIEQHFNDFKGSVLRTVAAVKGNVILRDCYFVIPEHEEFRAYNGQEFEIPNSFERMLNANS